MRGMPSRRDPLRVLLWAVSFAFALFLAYRFLSTVTTIVLTLAAAALLAVAASGPIEALCRRKVPRTLATALVFLGGAGILVLGGALLLPTLTGQVSDFFSSLPSALSQLEDRLRALVKTLLTNRFQKT